MSGSKSRFFAIRELSAGRAHPLSLAGSRLASSHREAFMLVFNIPLDLVVALAPFAAIVFWWLVSE